MIEEGENTHTVDRGEFRKNMKELLAWIEKEPKRRTIAIRDGHRKGNAKIYMVMSHWRSCQIYHPDRTTKKKGK